MRNYEDKEIYSEETKSAAAVIFLGVPGAGKTTQARLISLAFDFIYVSPGDIFRTQLNNSENHIYKQVASYMLQGILVPDELFMPLINSSLQTIYHTSKKLVLDGLPRSLSQAEWLNASFIEQGIPTCNAVYLKVSQDKAMERVAHRQICKKCHAPGGYQPLQMKCDFCGGDLKQRDDDKTVEFNHRLEEYYRQTEPLISLYEAENKLIEINGEQPIHIVFTEIIQALRPHLLP